MKFCTNCGAQLDDTARFCTNCGHRSEQAEPVVQAPKPEVPAAVHIYSQPEAPAAQAPEASAAVHVYGQPVNHSFSAPSFTENEQGVVHTYGAPVSHSFAPPVQAESALSGSYGAAVPVYAPASAPEPAAVPVSAPAAAPVSAPAPAPAVMESGAYTPPVITGEKKEKSLKLPAVPKLPAMPKPGKAAKGGRKKSRLGLIIGIVVAVVLLFIIFGGGGDSDDPNLGLYNAVSCSYGGFEMSADGEWIELKAKGKLKMNLMGETYSGKWELDEEDLTITQAGDTYYGTLKNGVIVLDLEGLIYTYEKEITEEEDIGKKDPDATVKPADPEVGFWTLKYSEGEGDMAMDEQTIELLKSMGIEIYVELKEDGTGIFMIDEAMEITWGDGKIVADDGSEVTYTLENGELIVDVEGTLMHMVPGENASGVESSAGLPTGQKMYYVAVSGTASGAEMNESTLSQMGGVSLVLNGDGTGTFDMFGQSDEITYDDNTITRYNMPMAYTVEGDYLYLTVSEGIEFTMMPKMDAMNRPQEELTLDDIGYWEGDYYGWWVIDNVIEGNSSAQGNWWDCCMTLDFNSDGTGTMVIWDEDYGKSDPILEADISVSNYAGVTRIVSESGQFMGDAIEHADWLFYSDASQYEDTLCFTVTYEDDSTKMDCYFFLRQWGTVWDDVETDLLPGYYDSWYLPLLNDGVTAAPETVG